MAPSSRKVLIPRIFNYLLPLQGIVAAVAIYSSIYVFGVGKIPFILNVVAAGLHFLLGVYFCITQARPGIHHAYIVPPWLLSGAAVWSVALYYFTKVLEAILKTFPITSSLNYPQPTQPLTPTWTKVGCAMTGFNVILDLTLLIWFILSILKQTRSSPSSQPQQTSFISTPIPPSHYPSSIPQFQSQPHQFSPPHPPPSPSDFKSSHPPSPPSYSSQNRISVLRRLCTLQHPNGHWDYSPELASLVKLWGGRELMSPAHGVTALTNACMTDLVNYIWQAQREGREHQMLTAAELISLQQINWDLGWARHAIERATAWMSGFT
ncbi:hypothetical protein QBC38DRAFT_242132 [Podospora fimiseda]|uniref:Uncharacterized protein n=1 Tax=Podospora fimiseda TaxID=252190 RepID=A0AAN7BX55_9PEZI|nr:hypothetical protein QBC38DRAFT_242132 [Podospora fimiseda]